MNILCAYGCNQPGNYLTISGNPCCSKTYKKCPAVLKRVADASGKKHHEIRENNIDEYNKHPKLCLNCNSPISYDKKGNTFCGSVCSGSYNTKGRKLDDSIKKKISETLLDGFNSGRLKPLNPCGVSSIRRHFEKKFSRVSFKSCKICNKLFTVRSSNPENGRKTCSDECSQKASFAHRKYQNGKRKTIPYNNLTQGIVYLESSWELEIAELLDSLNIEWIRPKFIPWIDSNNKKRLYFPDFYLPNYHVYLDPKNPYCMDQDKEKMEYITKMIYIIYGELDHVKDYILKIKERNYTYANT